MVVKECWLRELIGFVGLAFRAADFTITYILVVAGLSLAPLHCRAASSPSPLSPGNVSCSSWAPNSVQNVMVDGFARFGAMEGCGAELIGVSVTFFALPQSTIVLDGWSMRGGGYVAIRGPPTAPWSIRDVAVVVTNSVIEASGGPAVSVVLGAGYDASAASVDGGVVLRNVSLYCSGSRLWSSSSALNGQTSASVLSVTLASALSASAPNVNIDRFTAVAVDCDLRSAVTATPGAAAAVAGVASARYGGSGGGTAAWMTVSNSVLYVLRCNATAVVLPGTAVFQTEVSAVSAVAGVAFGKLSSVGLTVTSTVAAVVRSRVESTVTIGSTVGAYSGSTVAGVAVGYCISSSITIANNATFYLGWSSTVSNSVSTYANAFAGSSVAGVAIGQAYSKSPVAIAKNATFLLRWSNATSTGSSISINSYAFSGSTIAGVAVGQAHSSSPVTIGNGATFYVGRTNAKSSARTSTSTSDASAGSSVGGVAVGEAYASSPVIAQSSTFYVGWSNATSTCASIGIFYAGAGSTVAGIAVGWAYTYSPVTIANGTTSYVGWSNATSGSTSTSTTTSTPTGNYYAYAGSSVAGIAVGQAYTNSPITISYDTMISVGWSNATSASSSSSTKNGAPAASGVAGVAMGHAQSYSSLTIANSTFSTGYSNVTSSSTSISTDNTFAGSVVAGVAVGYMYSSDTPITIAGATFYVGWSNASSSSASTPTSLSKSSAYAASSVAGVAVGLLTSNFPITIANRTTFYLGWSDATSTATSLNSNAFAWSSVAGVASKSTALLTPLNMTSASNMSACASGLTSAAVSCMMAPLSSSSIMPLCCTQPSAPNVAFPLFSPRAPPDSAAGWDFAPPGVGLYHTTSPQNASNTASRASTWTQSPLYTTASRLATITLALQRGTSYDTAARRRPFPSSTVSGHWSATPTHVPTKPLVSPSPNPVRHGGVQGLGLGLDPTVVTAVVATGYGSSAVAAALSPTSGNKASAASRLVSGAECTVFGDEDLSSFPQPDDWSLMPALVASSVNLGSDDDSDASAVASKVLTTVALLMMACAANALWFAYRGSTSVGSFGSDRN